jgi:hypothetical protein
VPQNAGTVPQGAFGRGRPAACGVSFLVPYRPQSEREEEMAVKRKKGNVRKGGTKKIAVSVVKGRIEVRPEVQECDLGTTKVEFVWTLDTPGWRFTLDGIDIHQGDYAMGLLHERDRRLIKKLASEAKPVPHRNIGADLLAAYKRITKQRKPRPKQFVNPRRSEKETEFRWNNRNDYWDVFLYKVNVTDGRTTLTLDPAIQNHGEN